MVQHTWIMMDGMRIMMDGVRRIWMMRMMPMVMRIWMRRWQMNRMYWMVWWWIWMMFKWIWMRWRWNNGFGCSWKNLRNKRFMYWIRQWSINELMNWMDNGSYGCGDQWSWGWVVNWMMI